jgi:hypothetical protein
MDEDKNEEGDGPWKRLPSSNVYACRYNKKSQVLSAVSKGGNHHDYAGVSQDVAKGLETTSSLGSYIWQHFRRA